MAHKFALFTKGSKLLLNQGFQNRFLVTTVSRQALDMLLGAGVWMYDIREILSQSEKPPKSFGMRMDI